MLDADLLAMLCCPETGADLTEATPEELITLNGAIAAGGVVNRAGVAVTEKVDGGLIRVDRAWVYLVRDNIPIMLIDEALPGATLGGAR